MTVTKDAPAVALKGRALAQSHALKDQGAAPMPRSFFGLSTFQAAVILFALGGIALTIWNMNAA